ncbi:hypothetical protein SK128_009510 [Halocaridina rubra]|uniref:Membrane protein BRI3 n=1 Tax=Halocaridina rubra TaxID=373956 RepID=A0AAN9A4K7_HALRR
MSASPYDKLEDLDVSGDIAMLDAVPPPYSESPVSAILESVPYSGAYHAPAAINNAHSASVVGYPQILSQPAPTTQVIQVMPSAPAPTVNSVNVITSGMLPPGACTVCRKGQIKDTASCCTWFWCLLLLPFGIIPGIIAFCCCCRHPKCSHCGFSI